MSKVFYPLSAALVNATERQTAYAGSVLHAYKSSFVPAENSPLADFTAAECDYDGYASQTITAFFDPIFSAQGGYQISSPLFQFAYTDGVGHVGNTVGGLYMVDSGGDLRMVVAFDPGEYVTLAADGQGFDVSLADFFPTGF